MTVREYAFDQDYKLYRDGSFFDLRADPLEKSALQPPLTEKAASARKRLQASLDRYQAARPAELDAMFKAAAKDMPGKSGKTGKKGKAGKNKNL
jgi:arylsulfatase A